MSNPNFLLASLNCPSSTAVEEPSDHVFLQDFQEKQDMPGVSSLSGMTSVTEARNPPTHHDTSSRIRVTALLRDTVCSSTINSRPCNTVTTNVLSGGIPSTLPPPTISSSTHYHAVVCNSATCLGDRVITTPCPTPQGATSDVFDLSPPHQSTSCP